MHCLKCLKEVKAADACGAATLRHAPIDASSAAPENSGAENDGGTTAKAGRSDRCINPETEVAENDGGAAGGVATRASKTSKNAASGVATVKAAGALLRTIKPGSLSLSDLEELAAALGRVKNLVSWLLCETTRVVSEVKTDLDAVDMLKTSVRLSGKEAKQLSKVGKALPEMPNAARNLAKGEITLHHAASLTSAAEECGAEVVDNNRDLLKQAANVEVDRFARLAREFASKHSEDRGESKLDRQRRQRRATVFTNGETGMGILSGEFDPVSFNLMQQTIDHHTNALWKRDGGLNGKPDEVRSRKQRLCDAVFELITGRDAATHDPLPGGAGSTAVGGGTPLGRAKASAQLIVLADIGVLDGTNPLGRCEVLGTGRVPTDILRSLSPDTELAGLIFDGKSRSLWLGRNQRLANSAQRLALAVRDGGCVLCDEPMHRCQIHHIQEWNTEGGRTDLENLATLCGGHHRWLHNHGKTLQHTQESGWKVCDSDRKTGKLAAGARREHRTEIRAKRAGTTGTTQTRRARATRGRLPVSVPVPEAGTTQTRRARATGTTQTAQAQTRTRQTRRARAGTTQTRGTQTGEGDEDGTDGEETGEARTDNHLAIPH